MEKYREGQKELHCVFVDLEKLLTRFQEKSCGGMLYLRLLFHITANTLASNTKKYMSN